MNIQTDFSLKHLNTFGIDAIAKYFVEFKSVNELNEILITDDVKKMPKFVLGGGSNILFCKDYDGLALKNGIMGIDIDAEDENHVYIKTGAGEEWHKLVLFAVNNGYAGIENMSLIPGSVGAGPIQNIGAYGVELKDVLVEVEAIEIETGHLRRFTNEDCKFGYRNSIFKGEEKGKYIITSTTIRLNKRPVLNTKYGAIEEEIKRMGLHQISIKAISDAVINIRQSKLPDPAKTGNAGSFFKNPEIKMEQFDKLKEFFPNIIAFDTVDGNKKLAAGWLIEQCGWKGKRIGDAGVHPNQALVLVNYGNATGNEILILANDILKSVLEKFGVELETEVNII
jgi:UDP-N-acetylmuramate dehydrogenase